MTLADTVIAIVPVVVLVAFIILIVSRYRDGSSKSFGIAEIFPAFITVIVAVLVISFVISGDGDGGDSSQNGASYLYIIETDDTNEGILSVQASVDGKSLRTISEQRGYDGQGASNISDFWSFGEDGVGPFNSWYGAFNVSDYDGSESESPAFTAPGKLAYRLDPDDLTKTLAGESLSGTYNTFLVIPTVYWKAEDGKLYLSSEPSYRIGLFAYKGTAYAHTATVSGSEKVYPYIGIGVYQASVSDGKLLSAPDVSPAGNYTHDQFKAYADALTPSSGSDYQQWNYWQWTLCKMMGYTVLGTKNAQWMLGDGPSSVAQSPNTGLSASAGPYADSTAQYDKLFIENAWGGQWQLIGDAYTADRVIHAGNTLGGASIQAKGQPSLTGSPSLPSETDVFVSSAFTASDSWDLPLTTTTTYNYTDPMFQGDKVYTKPGDMNIAVGGWNIGHAAGLSCVNAGHALDFSYSSYGTRLCYVMEASAIEPVEEGTLFQLYDTVPASDFGTIRSVAGSASLENIGGRDYVRMTDLGPFTVTTEKGSREYGVEKAVMDLVIFAGQSNAYFFTSEQYYDGPATVPPGKAFYLGHVVDADAPNWGGLIEAQTVPGSEVCDIIGSDGRMRLAAMYPTFCGDYLKQSGNRLLTVSAAIGGTSITTWDAGGPCDVLVRFALDALKDQCEGKIILNPVAVMWWQGETDRNQTKAFYEEHFDPVLDKFRSGAYGIAFPCAMSMLPRIEMRPIDNMIPPALAQIEEASERPTFSVASDLTYRATSDDYRDAAHFKQPFYGWAGEAFARQLAEVKGWQPVDETIVIAEQPGTVSSLPSTITAYGTSGDAYTLLAQWTETSTAGTYTATLSGNPAGTAILTGLTATATVA